MKTYCIKEKKQTDCAPGSERYERAKNGRFVLKCQCISCGITKTKFVKDTQEGGNLFLDHLVWLGLGLGPNGGQTCLR